MPKDMDAIDWFYCASLQSVLGTILYMKRQPDVALKLYETAWNTLDAIDPLSLRSQEQRVVLRHKLAEVAWTRARVERVCEWLAEFEKTCREVG